jgi:hypothetical protein
MRRISILAIVLVVIAAGWTAAWFYVANLARQQITALATADGQSEPRVVCGRLDIGGYPLYLDVTCGGMTVTSDDLTTTVAEVKASVGIDDIWHTVAFITGPATFEDAFTGSKYRLDWQNLVASARLTDWRIARISIVGDGFALNETQGSDNLVAKTAHAELHLLDLPEQHDAAKHLAALHVYSTLTGLNAPGLQINDGKSTFDAQITNLGDDVRTYGDADMLKRWQTAGGEIKLAGFKGEDGPQNFAVTGHVGLDAMNRPAGQLAITSKGLVERLGPLVPDQWRAIILGTPSADGSYSQVLNMTNGLAFSGIVPLGTLPPLM